MRSPIRRGGVGGNQGGCASGKVRVRDQSLGKGMSSLRPRRETCQKRGRIIERAGGGQPKNALIRIEEGGHEGVKKAHKKLERGGLSGRKRRVTTEEDTSRQEDRVRGHAD